MPVTAIPNTGSQLDRAICAYLIANGCGTVATVTPAHCTQSKTYPSIVVKAFQGVTDNIEGNETWTVQIQAKQSAANQPAAENPESKRVDLDNFIGLALALMLQTNDNNTLDFTAAEITTAGRALAVAAVTTPKTWASVENNGDMADFTLKHLYYKSQARGEPDENGAAWVEIRTFECHCCPSNVD